MLNVICIYIYIRFITTLLFVFIKNIIYISTQQTIHIIAMFAVHHLSYIFIDTLIVHATLYYCNFCECNN